MDASIAIARAFVDANPNNRITFIGHSKGGAEAIANALVTGKNAITFNPAPVNLRAISDTHGIHIRHVILNTGIHNYVVRGDVLNVLFGNSSVGSTTFLPRQHGSVWDLTMIPNILQSLLNHHHPSIVPAVRQSGLGSRIPGSITTQTAISAGR